MKRFLWEMREALMIILLGALIALFLVLGMLPTGYCANPAEADWLCYLKI